MLSIFAVRALCHIHLPFRCPCSAYCSLKYVHKHGRFCSGALATVMDVNRSIFQCNLPRPHIRYTVSHDSMVQKVDVPSGQSVIDILSIVSHADVRREGLLHCSTTGRRTRSLSCKLQRMVNPHVDSL